MDERITEDYIRNAIEELINTFGVKEEIPPFEFSIPIQKGDIKQSVKNVAQKLGLPIEIIVRYVPKGYRPDGNIKFDSHNLAKTDSRGRGIESITAQVSMPPNLPLYGSSSLTGFPIKVMVSENCREEPLTFVAIMAHELSHILLGCLYHPKKNNEIYTDLTPMILGFSKIIEMGRKQISSTTSGTITTTNTVTYGYLTDTQFAFASERIKNILGERKQRKVRLLTSVAKTKRQFFNSRRNIFLFNEFLKYLGKNQKRKIKKRDIPKVVSFHSLGYTHDLESTLNEVRVFLEEVESHTKNITHYTDPVLQELQDSTKRGEVIANKLEHASYWLNDNLKILRRNVNLIWRIKTELFCNTAFSKDKVELQL